MGMSDLENGVERAGIGGGGGRSGKSEARMGTY